MCVCVCVCLNRPSSLLPPSFKPSTEPLMEDKPVKAKCHALLAAHQGHTQTEELTHKHTHIHAKKATQPNVPKAAHIHKEKYLGKQQAFSSIIGDSNTEHTLSHIPVEYTTIATACKQLIFSVMQQPSLTVSRVSNYTFICLSVVLKAT